MARTGGRLFGLSRRKRTGGGGAKPTSPTKVLSRPEVTSSKVLVLRGLRPPVHFGESGPVGVPSPERVPLVASNNPLRRSPYRPGRGLRPVRGRSDEEGRPGMPLAGRSPYSGFGDATSDRLRAFFFS